MKHYNIRNWSVARQIMFRTCIALILSLTPLTLHAQTFDSGSDGSDGALDFSGTAPGTTIIFDPTDFDPPLDPDGDNVYHFTTITIPEGVTIKLTSNSLLGSRAVYWLASGAVQIDGIIDLDGEDGHAGNEAPIPAIAGAGGYNGGVGGQTLSGPMAGMGPGGGRITGSYGGGAGHATEGQGMYDSGGEPYGNNFLLPLMGGSGGAGGAKSGTIPGGGGGAGGGALLIASSVTIAVNGSITARGGDGGAGGYHGGGGSGGAIRLIAPVLSVTGVLSAARGSGGGYLGAHGRIRVEAFQHNFTGTVNPGPVTATPGVPFLPSPGQPAVRVVSVEGVPVPAYPTGSFVLPDVVINEGGSVTLNIEAHHIPLGAVVQITIFSESGPLQTLDTTPLAGVLENSTASTTAIFPAGLSRVSVMATW